MADIQGSPNEWQVGGDGVGPYGSWLGDVTGAGSIISYGSQVSLPNGGNMADLDAYNPYEYDTSNYDSTSYDYNSGGSSFTGDTNLVNTIDTPVTGDLLQLDTSQTGDLSNQTADSAQNSWQTQAALNGSVDSLSSTTGDYSRDTTQICNSLGYDPDTSISGTGHTIGELAAIGWTANDLQSLLNQPILPGSSYTVGRATDMGWSDADIGAFVQSGGDTVPAPTSGNSGGGAGGPRTTDPQPPKKSATSPDAGSGLSKASGGGAGSPAAVNPLAKPLDQAMALLNKFGSTTGAALQQLLGGGSAAAGSSSSVVGGRSVPAGVVNSSSLLPSAASSSNLGLLMIIGGVLLVGFMMKEGA